MTEKLTEEELEERYSDDYCDFGILQKKEERWILIAEEGSLIGDQVLTDPNGLCKGNAGKPAWVYHNDCGEILYIKVKFED